MSRTVRYFESVATGDALDGLTKGPLTSTHLMRWSAAMENWHKIHYDRPFAIEHDGLPDVLVNGSLKQQFIMQFLKDFAGAKGWVWKVKFQFRAMDVVGARLLVWGKVTGLRRTPEFGLVDIELGVTNEKGVDSTPGQATIVLPYQAGPDLPYPFVPPRASDIVGASAD